MNENQRHDNVIDIEERLKRRKAKKKARNGSSRFVVWLLVVLLMLAGVLYFVVEMAKVQNVVIVGNEHYSEDAILEAVGIGEGATILDVYFYSEQDYSQYPYIDSVEVSYDGLNYLKVVVTEKEIVNYIPYQGSYLALDKDGYIIDYIEEIGADVPVIEGLYLEAAFIGEKLPVDESIISALLDLHLLKNKYGVPVSSIEFPYSDETMLYVYVNNIQIILGDFTDLDLKMKNAGEVLGKLSHDLSGTLDLQEDKEQFIFKKKEN